MKIVLLLALASAQLGAACLIRGTVLDAETGKPIPKTRVFVKPADGDATKPAILRITGEQGAFCFERLDPGVYDVVADRNGYLAALYGAKPGGDQGAHLKVDGQNELPLLTFKLLRGATIGGVVLDAAGEPRLGAEVKLNRKVWDKGWSPDEVKRTNTDDRGAFRFNRLTPGTYYPSVEGNGWQLIDENGHSITEALTFHSSSLTFAGATPIPLRSGQEVGNLVLTIGRVAARRLRGRLSSSVDEVQGKIYLYSDTAPGRGVSLDKDGAFSVDGLLPAKYRIRVAGIKVRISVEVDLTHGDVDGLVLDPEPTFDVRFSARGEGAAPLGPLQLSVKDPDTGFMINARQEADGSYLVKAPPPGIYRLEASRTDHVFVKGLKINGQPKADAMLDLRQGPPGTVEAILSPNVATLEGRLDRPQGALPSLATTVVVMDEAKSRTGVAGEQVAVDQTGRFKVESLAPGKYRLFAVEGFEEGLWGSLELAEALREKSLVVELRENESQSLAVPVITLEEWNVALRKVGM